MVKPRWSKRQLKKKIMQSLIDSSFLWRNGQCTFEELKRQCFAELEIVLPYRVRK